MVKTIKLLTLLTVSLITLNVSHGQDHPFGIYLEPLQISGLGGLQSFAWGQHDGKWLIVGGRLDGLHRRQPFAAFDVAGNNNQLIVVDPVAGQKWSAHLTSLSVSLQEQMSSTNMEFEQEGDYLYVIGGYGYNALSASRKTFDNLTAINVPEVIQAIINQTSFTGYFRQISDPLFAVTGGHLHKIYDVYHLVGGNKFDGNYNPMGNPTFTQVYTNAIRKFKISDDGVNLSVTHLTGHTDAANLHRRDYNAVPQILPDGSEGITAFSGVFQLTANLPFLNCVNIDSNGYTVNNNFQQYYNHYHCAVLPVYSAASNRMHTIFFGGIAQYYDSAGVLVQDNNVPFVKTIARVTRSSDGSMAEYKLPVDMPGLLGAGAEFISANYLPKYANGVFMGDSLSADSTLAGYIFGGISSSAPNIFFINTGTQSTASSQLFKVYLIRNNGTGLRETLNRQSTGTLAMQVYPNPSGGSFSVKFTLKEAADVKITIHAMDGRMVVEKLFTDMQPGDNAWTAGRADLFNEGSYYVTIETPDEKATQKVILSR